MSRLIDADETKRAFVGNRYGSKAIEYVIDSQPTVKAIPIEWLKKWEEKHKNDPCYCDFVTDEILADWEKENE